MKIPRMRLTVRRLMVAVVIVGLLLGCVQWMQRRRERLRSLAQGHGYSAEVCEAEMLMAKINKKPAAWMAGRRSRLEYHLSLMEKYRWASRHPWLPIEADPPEPK